MAFGSTFRDKKEQVTKLSWLSCPACLLVEVSSKTFLPVSLMNWKASLCGADAWTSVSRYLCDQQEKTAHQWDRLWLMLSVCFGETRHYFHTWNRRGVQVNKWQPNFFFKMYYRLWYLHIKWMWDWLSLCRGVNRIIMTPFFHLLLIP